MYMNPETPDLDALYSQAAKYEELEEREEEHYEKLEYLESRLMEQQVQLEKWENRARNYRSPEPKPFLSDEKRKALQELLDK